jgi:hypothetical protein
MNTEICEEIQVDNAVAVIATNREKWTVPVDRLRRGRTTGRE